MDNEQKVKQRCEVLMARYDRKQIIESSGKLAEKYGWTPLHYAIYICDLDLTRKFWQIKEFNKPDNYGVTPEKLLKMMDILSQGS